MVLLNMSRRNGLRLVMFPGERFLSSLLSLLMLALFHLIVRLDSSEFEFYHELLYSLE